MNTDQSKSQTNSSKSDDESTTKGWSGAHVQFYQAKEMRDLIILDNGSTVSLFCNPNLVENIITVKETLELSTNGGNLFTNQRATVPGYGEVWYDPKAITNIFSMS